MAAKQADVALGVIEPHSAGVLRVASIAGPRMTRILAAMILGDFISVYLAYLNGADPTPVENIDYLKKQLEI
jgi:glucose/mannose-6-phosphate isomerase